MRVDADLLVVGGGMVGAALACLLGRGDTGLSVCVLEAGREARWQPGASYDLRVSAISRASGRILEAAGAWSAIAGGRVSPYREMRVWDARGGAEGPGAIHFDAAELGEPELGHIVENALVQQALRDAARRLPGVRWIAGAKVTGLDLGGRAARVELEDARALSGRLVVAADGARSATRELAGIETRGWDYEQRAVVTHVATAKPHRETAWQRFLPTGPLAFLPLADGRSSIVWSTRPEHAAELLEMDAEAFCAALTEASDGVLGTVADCAERAGFPLGLRYAREYCRPRLALVGDAAHAVHPLAGQGVNLGFLDAAALAEVLAGAVGREEDPGSLAVLRRYARWRKGENLAAQFGFDLLARLFAGDPPVRGAVRRIGLSLVNHTPMVKNELVRRAMGLKGDLPRVARRQVRELME